ncbi:hypothetical protein GF318_05340 [Candidatus Micrarchaeota archaeon]|nr:hypothetical protein [Candidatus Micrarchaeota archaeon]
MKKEILHYFRERFGIPPSCFQTFSLYAASRGRIYVGPETTIPRPEPVSVGILAARTGNAIKPTTAILQLLGRHATRNIVRISRKDAEKFAGGQDLKAGETEATEGYVLVSYQDTPLGCGFLKGGTVRSMIPKAKRLQLKFL